MHHRVLIQPTGTVAPHARDEHPKPLWLSWEALDEIIHDTPNGRLTNVVFNLFVWAVAFIPYMILYAPTPSHTNVSLMWTLANQTLNTHRNVQTVGLRNASTVVQLNWAFTGLFIVNICLLFIQGGYLMWHTYNQLVEKKEFWKANDKNGDPQNSFYNGRRDYWFPLMVFANYPLMAVILLNLMGVDNVYAALGVSAAIVGWNMTLTTNSFIWEYYDIFLAVSARQGLWSTPYLYIKKKKLTMQRVLVTGTSFCYAVVIAIFALPVKQLISIGVNHNLYISFILFMSLFSGQTFLDMLFTEPCICACNQVVTLDATWRRSFNLFYHILKLFLFTAFFISIIFLLSNEYLV